MAHYKYPECLLTIVKERPADDDQNKVSHGRYKPDHICPVASNEGYKSQ
jgi:hypothetical protein